MTCRRDLPAATDRLDTGTALGDEEREALPAGVRVEQAATGQVGKLRAQPARAEDFGATLRDRLERAGPPAGPGTEGLSDPPEESRD